MSEATQDTCICVDLRTAANQLTHLYDKAMAPAGISVTQFSQLHQVQRLQGPTLKTLAEATRLDRSTLGRNVRVLEKLGLVELRIGDDARTRHIHITRRGKNAFRKALPLWYGVQSQLTEQLGAGRRAELKQLLDELTGISL